MIAPYIQYSPDFTKVTGTEGVGFKRRTIPVYIGRRSRAAQKMTTRSGSIYAEMLTPSLSSTMP